jgi:methylglyoxal synthase
LAIVGSAITLAIAALAIGASPAVVGPTLGFAGWEPAPTTPEVAFANAAAKDCQIEPSMRLMAHDQRGTAATLVFVGAGQLSLCLVATDSTGDIVAAATGTTRLEAMSGPLSVDTGLSAPAGNKSPGVRIMAGRALPPISAVDVVRADGVDVKATVASGVWVAWWPSTTEGTNVRAVDWNGSVVATAPGVN